ncbi:MAG: bifunctional nuclease domain-containing protein [Fermentimonas sp.]|jgi:bifunctional DNase/RNase
MDNERIELSIMGISYSQVQAGAYAIILSEVDGRRRLPIVVGTPEAQSIAVVMENIRTPRPLSHDLFTNILKSLSVDLVEVMINKFEDGAFHSEILLNRFGVDYRFDSRTSDAIALAIRTNSPIYTTNEIMMQHGIVFDESDVSGNDGELASDESGDVEDIYNELDDSRLDALKNRLEDAIREEDYELATKLRDEIKRRESYNKQDE